MRVLVIRVLVMSGFSIRNDRGVVLSSWLRWLKWLWYWYYLGSKEYARY